jgi:hypothetical protein
VKVRPTTFISFFPLGGSSRLFPFVTLVDLFVACGGEEKQACGKKTVGRF